ncbi:hypothetical protein QUF64_01485 [Anaerolineales bacterium HSG6]|nr:hypothetical protein [Anaerolineales bacterium HSG6]
MSFIPKQLIPLSSKQLTPLSRAMLVLSLFIMLTIGLLYPLSTRLSSMVPEPTDPLLNAWRMQWNAHALLSSPSELFNIFDTNIFHPYPLTLVYSEHFLLITWQHLPFLLLPDSHLFGMNMAVLLTFILSAYGMYLLVTAWSGNRWAGLVAGVMFAFAPQRLGQLNHLELLITHWMPLALLCLHWTLTRSGKRYPTALIIFLTMQALSGFHFFLNLVIAASLLCIVYALRRHIYWRRGLWIAGAIAVGMVTLLNAPIWWAYLQFSDRMGAVRTPGEVRIYSAALTDYLTTIPHHVWYGWTFGYWQTSDHQFQPLMPIGLVGLSLILVGMGVLVYRVGSQKKGKATFENKDDSLVRRKKPLPLVGGGWEGGEMPANHDFDENLRSFINPHLTISHHVFLILLTLIGLLLSFGLNENALGPNFSAILSYSPYRWLYDYVIIFQAIRVPARFSVLVLLSLSILIGLSVGLLLDLMNFQENKSPTTNGALASDRHVDWKPTRHFTPTQQTRLSAILSMSLILLFMVEFWTKPLQGPEFPTGQEIDPTYTWLHDMTPADSVILELPHQDASEFLYEYYSSHHWRRMVNGGTGYTPPIYKELRRWFNAFPDSRSIDLLQQLGVTQIVLHPSAYSPEDWQRVMDDLPRYLPTMSHIKPVGENLIIDLTPSACPSDPTMVQVTMQNNPPLDGLDNTVAVTYHNHGLSAYRADVSQTSQLQFAHQPDKTFTEPLITPAGGSQTVIVPLKHNDPLQTIQLTSLGRTVSMPDGEPAPEFVYNSQLLQPLGLRFADGPRLMAYNFQTPMPTPCSHLLVALQWQDLQSGDSLTAQLLDPYSRLLVEQQRPFADEDDFLLALPLVDTVPPGLYGLRVRVHSADEQERWPMTEEGVTIPPDQLPVLPITIHPRPVDSPTEPPVAQFATPDGVTINLLDSHLNQTSLTAGGWLGFSLTWQADQSINQNYTVFSQLIGPEGKVWGQRDNEPGGGWYSTSLWQPNQAWSDSMAFQISPDAPPGQYRLIGGLYDSQTQQRLPIQTNSDFVELGVVEVTSP